MQPYPHLYSTNAEATAAGAVTILAEGLPDLPTNAPREFDGPGDQWSPESLLSAALASCFILTFRAMARASRLEWTRLQCTVEATLERVEGVAQFSRILTRARLTVPATANDDLCRRLLEKAEHGCLVANSLRSKRELASEIVKD